MKDPCRGGDGEREGSFAFCFLFVDYAIWQQNTFLQHFVPETCRAFPAGSSGASPLTFSRSFDLCGSMPSVEGCKSGHRSALPLGARAFQSHASLRRAGIYSPGPAEVFSHALHLHLRVIGVTCSEGRDEAVSNWGRGRNLACVPRGCFGAGQGHTEGQGAERCPTKAAAS